MTPPTFSARDWVPLTDAFLQIMSIVRRHDLSRSCINQDLRSGKLKSALVKISPDGGVTMTLLNRSDWEQRTVEAPLNPAEGVRVEPSMDGHVYVRRVDLDKHYSVAATPTMTATHKSDDTRPPERRRGPVLKYEWFAIAGEIARRCINPKTRVLEVPKNERKLAKAMLDWCQEKYGKDPAESEMREAVKAICAALRAHK